MSHSKKVQIKNKRTGKITEGLTAMSAMKWKENEHHRTNLAPDESVQQKSMLTTDTQRTISKNRKETNEVVNPELVQQKSKKTCNKIEIGGLAEYIEYAYTRKGQRLRLTPAWRKVINKHAQLDNTSFEKLLRISDQDRLLAVPRQILLKVHGIEWQSLAKQETRRFVSEVLKRHSVYTHNNLVAVLDNLDDALEPEDAIRTLAKLDPELLGQQLGLENPKPKEIETLRQNAINSLALWIWESRGQQVKKVIRWLHGGYWDQKALANRDDIASLRAITDLTNVEGVGIACSVFKAEADDHINSVLRHQCRNEVIETQLAALRQTISVLESDINQRDQTISQFEKKLEVEKSEHANSRAHLGDDHEHLRARVIRRLKSEVGLLTEGLQALRKDPPKVRVMDDHAERVLEGLLDEIKHLEAED